MDASHDQNFMCKIVKIGYKICLFCCKKYPIPTCILFLFFLSYLFFPLVLTFLIYASPLVGFTFLVHRILLGIDRQKIKRVEEDDRRKKFVKSRRSFKSIYGDRSHLIRRNAQNKSDDYIDKNAEDKDDFFSKSLNDLLIEKKPKDIQEENVESIAGKGEFLSSNGNVNGNTDMDELEGESSDVSEDEDDEPQDKVVQWTEDDQKNVMDLGLSEAERNRRLESLMERRKSRKNLGFEEGGSTGNNNDVQISAIKTTKINPFLEDNSCGKKSPGSAPSSLLPLRNPFDLPYDPHEEKPDLSGDNFQEEFTVGHQKEPIFCRHQSFSLGAFSHPEITNDKHGIYCYKDLATNQKSGLGTSTIDNGDDNKHVQQDSLISDDSINRNHPRGEGESSESVVSVVHKKDETEKKTQEIDVHLNALNIEESEFQGNVDSYDEQKADINFFYGINKQVGHAVSNSMVSDLQVEVSDEETAANLDDLDIEKDKKSLLNSLNVKGDSEVVKEDGEKDNMGPILNIDMEGHYVGEENNPGIMSSSIVSTNQSDQETLDKECLPEMDNQPQPLNSDTIQSNHIHESPGLTEVTVGEASVGSSSPKSVLRLDFSADPASPYDFANEVQQSDNHTTEANSSENGLHQIKSSGENPFSERDNFQDQRDRRL